MKTKGKKKKRNRGITRNLLPKVLPDFMTRDALTDVIGGVNKESKLKSVESYPSYVRDFSCAHKYHGGECVHTDCWANPSFFLSQPDAEKTEVILYMADSVLTSNTTWEPTEMNLL